MDNEIEDIPFGVGEQPTEKIVGFFKGEASEKFIEQEEMVTLVAYAYSLKETLEDVKAKHEKAIEEIKRRLDADKMEGKKVVKDFDERKVILSKSNGAAKVDWESWSRTLIGDKDVDNLLHAKENRIEHKHITFGKDVVRCEIV